MTALNATGTADPADAPAAVGTVGGAVGAVDAGHVAEVCRLAVAAMPYATRYSARAISRRVDGSGVTITVASPRVRRTVEHALRQHGYQLAHVPPAIPPGDPAAAPARPASGPTAGPAVGVVGWSPSGLVRRVAALTRAATRLERALPATITRAVHAYVQPHDDLDPTIALYGMADALRADLQAQVTRQVGPLPRRRPARHNVTEPVRQRLAIIDDLTKRITDLLAAHWQAAVRAAVRHAELTHRHPPADAQAKAIADTRASIRRQRHTDVFLHACAWADTHLDPAPATMHGTADAAGPDVTPAAAFAWWYLAEHTPPNGTVVPFEQAARRWHTQAHTPARIRTAGTRPIPPTSASDTPSGGTR